MLTHPTLDKLHALRLQGMAQAFEEQLRTPGIEDLSAEERLRRYSSTASSLGARPGVWQPDCATPSCAMAPASKTSTTATRAGWTSPCS